MNGRPSCWKISSWPNWKRLDRGVLAVPVAGPGAEQPRQPGAVGVDVLGDLERHRVSAPGGRGVGRVHGAPHPAQRHQGHHSDAEHGRRPAPRRRRLPWSESRVSKHAHRSRDQVHRRRRRTGAVQPGVHRRGSRCRRRAEVSLWLTGEAAWFAVPGRAEEFELDLATPLAELRDLVLSGGTLTVCSQCAQRRGLVAGRPGAGSPHRRRGRVHRAGPRRRPGLVYWQRDPS